MDTAIQTTTKNYDVFESHLRRVLSARAAQAHRMTFLTHETIHARLAKFARDWRDLVDADLASTTTDLAALLIDICHMLEVPMEGILTDAEITATMDATIQLCKNRPQ
jgi:hypothetical protein